MVSVLFNDCGVATRLLELGANVDFVTEVIFTTHSTDLINTITD